MLAYENVVYIYNGRKPTAVAELDQYFEKNERLYGLCRRSGNCDRFFIT